MKVSEKSNGAVEATEQRREEAVQAAPLKQKPAANADAQNGKDEQPKPENSKNGTITKHPLPQDEHQASLREEPMYAPANSQGIF